MTGVGKDLGPNVQWSGEHFLERRLQGPREVAVWPLQPLFSASYLLGTMFQPPWLGVPQTDLLFPTSAPLRVLCVPPGTEVTTCLPDKNVLISARASPSQPPQTDLLPPRGNPASSPQQWHSLHRLPNFSTSYIVFPSSCLNLF